MKNKNYICIILFGLISLSIFSQQVADITFNPVIPRPEYAQGI